jgi:hypothetical protein
MPLIPTSTLYTTPTFYISLFSSHGLHGKGNATKGYSDTMPPKNKGKKGKKGGDDDDAYW